MLGNIRCVETHPTEMRPTKCARRLRRSDERPGHDDVALVVAAQCKDVVADFDKAELLVERDGAGVFLPNAEPDYVAAAFCHFIEAGLHQLLGEAFAVPGACDVQALDFTGVLTFHAGWRVPKHRHVAPAQLRVGHQFSRFFTWFFTRLLTRFFINQGQLAGVGDLRRLNGCTLTLLAMPVHVLGSVHRGEGVAKGALGKRGEGSGVTWLGGSQVWQGALRAVNEGRAGSERSDINVPGRTFEVRNTPKDCLHPWRQPAAMINAP